MYWKLEEIPPSTLVELYYNLDSPDLFLVGFVVAINEFYLLMELVDEYGVPDGWSLRLRSSIWSHSTVSKYLERFNDLRPKLDIATSDVNAVISICVKNEYRVELTITSGIELSGCILATDGDRIALEQEDDRYRLVAIRYLNIDDVEGMEFGSTERRSILR